LNKSIAANHAFCTLLVTYVKSCTGMSVLTVIFTRKIENGVIVVTMDKKYDKYDDDCHFLALEKN